MLGRKEEVFSSFRDGETSIWRGGKNEARLGQYWAHAGSIQLIVSH